MTIVLSLSWSTSRGVNTYGYNIARLDESADGKRYRCMGGGYDMVGTVVGKWLQDRYQDRLRELADRAYYVSGYTDGNYHHARAEGDEREGGLLYGMTALTEENGTTRILLDGACGIESMLKIGKAIGLTFERTYVPRGPSRGNTTGWVVTDTKED